MEPRKTILFLCTGNSARSQMAEAIVNHRFGEEWQAFSAGVNPTGYIHPLALQALKEMGIEHVGRSKHVDEFKGQDFDLVVTVCDEAAEECPVWLGRGHKEHLGFPDPAKANGTEEDKLDAFRSTRDALAEQVPAMLKAAFSPTRSDVP